MFEAKKKNHNEKALIIIHTKPKILVCINYQKEFYDQCFIIKKTLTAA